MVWICRLIFLFGVYMLFSELYPAPSAETVKAVSAVKLTTYQKYENLLDKLAVLVSRFVRLSGYKKDDFTRMLNALNIPYSAEVYIAKIVLRLALSGMVFVVLSLVNQLFLLVGLVILFVGYKSQMGEIKKKYKEHITSIELELPKLCSVINSRIISTSNTLDILNNFLPIADKSIAQEISITINEMKIGNAENALRNLERRVNSPKMSDVVRGLISVQNGADQTVYFQSKQHQFNSDYQMMKRKQISQRPLKMTAPSIVLVGFFLAILLFTLGNSLSGIVGNLF